MHHVQYAKREVAQAGAQQKCAARAVKKASAHATQRRLHADQQRTYLEHGGCTCGPSRRPITTHLINSTSVTASFKLQSSPASF